MSKKLNHFYDEKIERTIADENECSLSNDKCPYNQICENFHGGHRCVCRQGYKSNGPGQPCTGV